MNLETFFKQYPRVALAFSGGVDSAYLLYMAHHLGAKVQPYFIKTAFQPTFEQEDAMAFCKSLGISLRVLHLPVLENQTITQNPSNRCYYCKTELFTALLQQTKQDGFEVVIDGTNASDEGADRPGMQALAELGVYSPLRLAGLTKEEIRKRSKQAGLWTHDKPAYACLATRVPTGMEITKEILCKIEASEKILFTMGFSDFRVRVLSDVVCKIECTQAQMPILLVQRENILQAFQPFWKQIFLDLEARG